MARAKTEGGLSKISCARLESAAATPNAPMHELLGYAHTCRGHRPSAGSHASLVLAAALIARPRMLQLHSRKNSTRELLMRLGLRPVKRRAPLWRPIRFPRVFVELPPRTACPQVGHSRPPPSDSADGAQVAIVYVKVKGTAAGSAAIKLCKVRLRTHAAAATRTHKHTHMLACP